jgi:EAL domain-containing protein (putative c-di-GMP-specific phosphodiesterase class I)
LNKPVVVNDNEIQVNFTGGIAVFPADGNDAETLYPNAEAALKKAKSSNEQYLFYQPEMTVRIAETLQLEGKLRQALNKEQFVLHYQPKIDTKNHQITGLEALIRWNDPETGLVPPGKFIPILEETGLILDVGMWALDRAASDYRQWQKLIKTVPRIAVNVSSIQLRQKDFVAQVEQAIRRSGKAVPIDIELTESLIMTDIEDNITKLKAIRMAGLGVDIDDFGTGYSSLSYIAKLPIDALKIDRSFIMNMTTQPESMTIVSTIITLAHALQYKVIAEGVETEEQAKFLTLLKCDEMQGFLFSKPLPPDEIFELLRSGKML